MITRYAPTVEAGGPARPLRILTYLHGFDPGGVERVALRLNAAWAARGAQTNIIVGCDSGAARAPATAIQYQVLAGRFVPGPRTRIVHMLLLLPAIIRRDRPDVIFCAGNTYSAIAVGLRLILGKACPPIIAKISNDLARRDMPWLVRVFYHRWLKIQGRLIDHFVGMAPAMAQEIAEGMRVGRDRITIINDPVLFEAELDRLGATRSPPLAVRKGRRFIAIGRLTAQKNFALLLAAFARIAAPDDRLTILGEGPERADLEQRAARLGIADRLAMPGHVDSLDHWLRDADTLVMSSAYEGVPAVIIEAVAAGLAVVATDCSVSMPDLLGQGRFGKLVPTGDVAALAGAMDKASRCQPCTDSARAHARRFTIEAGAAAYLETMSRLVRAEAASEG